MAECAGRSTSVKTRQKLPEKAMRNAPQNYSAVQCKIRGPRGLFSLSPPVPAAVSFLSRRATSVWKALRQRCLLQMRCCYPETRGREAAADPRLQQRDPEPVVSSAPSTHRRRHFVVCCRVRLYHCVFWHSIGLILTHHATTLGKGPSQEGCLSAHRKR